MKNDVVGVKKKWVAMMVMTVAIDYDGTLMKYPEMYGCLMRVFGEAGIAVGILTGRGDETKADDILRIEAGGVSPDFYLTTSLMNDSERLIEKMILHEQINMDRDELVCIFKARICHEHDIDILFDDAADKIRLYLPEGCKTVVFKSPTEHNMVVQKWGKAHGVEYEEKAGEIVNSS